MHAKDSNLTRKTLKAPKINFFLNPKNENYIKIIKL